MDNYRIVRMVVVQREVDRNQEVDRDHHREEREEEVEVHGISEILYLRD